MDINFNKNEDSNKLLLSELKKKFLKVQLGGGEKNIEKHKAKGKLTARERIDYLLDKNGELLLNANGNPQINTVGINSSLSIK